MAQAIEPVHYVDYESEHITFRSLWHAAQVLREAGEKDDSNGFWSLMAATLLVYTAYEGFTNDLIERLYPDVWKKERTFFQSGKYRGTLGKTKFLADQLSVTLKQTRRPYCTVAELQSWRNDLVHPRTVRLKGTARADAYARQPKRAAPIAFVKMRRPSFIPRSFEDVSALADVLLEAAAKEHWAEVDDLGESAFLGPLGSGGASLKR